MTAELGFTGPGAHPDDYEVVELVDTGGGQGHVFRAILRSDRLGAALVDAEVALKQVSTGMPRAQRIEELSEVVRARRHPHLARQIEVFRGPAPRPAGEPTDDADLLYVASLWAPGDRLSDVGTTASLGELLTWIRQIGSALDYLHSDVHDDGPVVHRDVKPANVLVTPTRNAILIDPGLARVATAGATGTPWGSPGFIPPETADPEAGGPASDRWQLAATLVAVLLGDAPGPRPDRGKLRQRLRQRLERDLRDPGPLVDGILAMLATDPDDRPASAGDWAADLGARAASGTHRASRWRVPALTVVGAVLVAGAVVTATALADDDDSQDVATRDGRDLTVEAVMDNRVTNAMAMREDTPAYLSTVTENFCRPNGCDVPGTDLVSGDRLTLVCQTVGQRTTNGDDTSTVDDANPERYESRLWYYAVVDGKEGYISEVWLREDFRGGLDLPLC